MRGLRLPRRTQRLENPPDFGLSVVARLIGRVPPQVIKRTSVGEENFLVAVNAQAKLGPASRWCLMNEAPTKPIPRAKFQLSEKRSTADEMIGQRFANIEVAGDVSAIVLRLRPGISVLNLLAETEGMQYADGDVARCKVGRLRIVRHQLLHEFHFLLRETSVFGDEVD